MPPKHQPTPQPFEQDEKILCFHLDMLYEAKILQIQPSESGDGFQYKVHYKGWKNTWDDWVPADRIRKFTDENKELANHLQAQIRNLNSKGAKSTASRRSIRGGLPGADSMRGSEERASLGGPASAQGGRGPRRTRDYDLEQEDDFHSRPTVKLVFSDFIRGLMVDDWENITHKSLLVPIPHPTPANQIFDDYLEFERQNRVEGSANMDTLEEIVAGLRVYYNQCLGPMLLYRFERIQWHKIKKMIDTHDEDSAIKTPADAYGAEHLARLIVSMEGLVAQTNMDQQSVQRLREELTKFVIWFTKNAEKYFVKEYETPSQEYLDKARSF